MVQRRSSIAHLFRLLIVCLVLSGWCTVAIGVSSTSAWGQTSPSWTPLSSVTLDANDLDGGSFQPWSPSNSAPISLGSLTGSNCIGSNTAVENLSNSPAANNQETQYNYEPDLYGPFEIQGQFVAFAQYDVGADAITSNDPTQAAAVFDFYKDPSTLQCLLPVIQQDVAPVFGSIPLPTITNLETNAGPNAIAYQIDMDLSNGSNPGLESFSIDFEIIRVGAAIAFLSDGATNQTFPDNERSYEESILYKRLQSAVPAPPPKPPAFTVTPFPLTAVTTESFQKTGTGLINWDPAAGRAPPASAFNAQIAWGDGSSSRANVISMPGTQNEFGINAPNGEHIYQKAGTIKGSITVHLGSTSSSATMTVQVLPFHPLAVFQSNPSNPTQNGTSLFIPQSAQHGQLSITKYKWDFAEWGNR